MLSFVEAKEIDLSIGMVHITMQLVDKSVKEALSFDELRVFSLGLLKVDVGQRLGLSEIDNLLLCFLCIRISLSLFNVAFAIDALVPVQRLAYLR